MKGIEKIMNDGIVLESCKMNMMAKAVSIQNVYIDVNDCMKSFDEPFLGLSYSLN